MSRILMVENDRNFSDGVCKMLARLGYQVTPVESVSAALKCLHDQHWEGMILDLNIPRDAGTPLVSPLTDPTSAEAYLGFEVYRNAQKIDPELPVIILTSFAAAPPGHNRPPVEAMLRRFDQLPRDFLTKGDTIDLLESRLQQFAGTLSQPVAAQLASHGIFWDNQRSPLRRILAKIYSLHKRTTPVLFIGDTGTGKGELARVFQILAPDKPFFELNCAALPEGVLETELFGVERAVGTGVTKGDGFLKMANGGILFLDEVGEMPAVVQGKLLHALSKSDDGIVRFRPVGGSEVIESKVRILAATNRDLLRDCEDGNFRFDLYARLANNVIQVPRLRERRCDVRRIIEGMAKQRNMSIEYDPVAECFLDSYSWPLNVRQVRNLVHNLHPDDRGKAWITIGTFPEEMLGWARRWMAEPDDNSSAVSEIPEGGLDRAQNAFLLQAVSKTVLELGGKERSGIKLELGKRLLGSKTSNAIGKRIDRALRRNPDLWPEFKIIQELWPDLEPAIYRAKSGPETHEGKHATRSTA